MGRTNISAGRMSREPSIPKPNPVQVQPPQPITAGGSTPSSPSPPSSTPETTIGRPYTISPQHTSSPPSKPDTKIRATKPRPEPQPVSTRTRTRPLTLRSGKKIAPPLTGAQAEVAKPQSISPLTHTRLLNLRSGKKIVPPLTRAQAKLGVRDNTLTVDSLTSSSSDEAECEEEASNSPEPKRKKIASGPTDYIPLSHKQLRNSPKCDCAAKTKPTQEKTIEKESITKQQQLRQRIVDESTEDNVPLTSTSSPSHSNGDNSSLRTSVALLTTAVLLNTRVLKRQEAQLNRLERMVQSFK